MRVKYKSCVYNIRKIIKLKKKTKIKKHSQTYQSAFTDTDLLASPS